MHSPQPFKLSNVIRRNLFDDISGQVQDLEFVPHGFEESALDGGDVVAAQVQRDDVRQSGESVRPGN